MKKAGQRASPDTQAFTRESIPSPGKPATPAHMCIMFTARIRSRPEGPGRVVTENSSHVIKENLSPLPMIHSLLLPPEQLFKGDKILYINNH